MKKTKIQQPEVDTNINMIEDLTQYDIKPQEFVNYLRYYGSHFNYKLCEFACSQFPKTYYTKEQVDELLKTHNITISNSKLYDYVYVANWCMANFYGSSIPSEKHLALFIWDIFKNEGDLIFNRWYADMAKLGIPIDWKEMI